MNTSIGAVTCVSKHKCCVISPPGLEAFLVFSDLSKYSWFTSTVRRVYIEGYMYSCFFLGTVGFVA